MTINIMLVDKTGEYSDPFAYNPRDFSADSKDPVAPVKHPWAEAALRQLDKAIKVIKKNEQTISRKNRVFDAFSLETKNKGVILIAQHDYLHTIEGLEKPDELVAESITLPAPYGPAIILDEKRLANAPSIEDAAYQLGHGLGKYFNETKKKFAPKGPNAHCESPLFILAARLDDIVTPPLPHVRLVEYTKDRLKQESNNLPIDEMFADIHGQMLSEGSNSRKVVSPLVEDYMKGPFAMDMLYRSNPKPSLKEKEDHAARMTELFSERSGMDFHIYDSIMKLIVKAKTGNFDSSEAFVNMLEWAEQQVAKAIESFKPPELLAESAINSPYQKN